MPGVIDGPLDRYERMAVQTHPEVLPRCVDDLNSAVQEAHTTHEQVTEYHTQEKRRFYQKIGFASLAAAVVTAETYPLSHAMQSEFLTKFSTAAGVVVVSFLVGREIPQTMRRIRVSHHVSQRRSQLEQLHRTAYARAVAMGLIPQSDPTD